MNFTYRAYEELLDLLEENKYDVQNYHNYQESPSISHIAHNCVLESDVALATYPCRLGGSTHIVQNGYLAGAITRNQSSIGRDAFIGIEAVVVKNVEAGQIVVGNPAKPFVKKT